MLKVQKNDGRIEDYDRSKLTRGLISAGASVEDVDSLKAKIEEWLPTVTVNGVVKSIDLRTKVLEILREINPKVAESFEAYKKG